MSELEIPGYRIEGQIGQGGMGVVYKATHLALDRVVALKVLSPELASTKEFVAGLSQEAKIAARLNHPNLVSVHDFNSHEGVCYIVMQYVEGQTVKEMLQTRLPSVEECIAILKQAASALDYAHSQGVIHRDIKPSNIMLRSDGRAMIMDFGVACAVRAEGMTGIGMGMGTPNYMSPEQCMGKTLDQRSDIYSLGVVLYEMLTGRLPFRGENAPGVMCQHMNVEPPPFRSARLAGTPEVEKAVFRAMAKTPSSRFPTADALTKAFETAYRNPTAFEEAGPGGFQASTSLPPPTGPLPRAAVSLVGMAEGSASRATTALPERPIQYVERDPQRGRAWLWIGLIALLCLLGVGGYMAYPTLFGGAASPPASTTPGGQVAKKPTSRKGATTTPSDRPRINRRPLFPESSGYSERRTQSRRPSGAATASAPPKSSGAAPLQSEEEEEAATSHDEKRSDDESPPKEDET